jgi:hypothetical protein
LRAEYRCALHLRLFEWAAFRLNKHSVNHDPSLAQSTSYLGGNFGAWYHAYGRTDKERVELWGADLSTFNSEQYQPQCRVKYEWSPVPTNWTFMRVVARPPPIGPLCVGGGERIPQSARLITDN